MSLPLLSNPALMQNQWKSILDPIVAIPFNSGIALTGIALAANTPLTIPTTLGRMQLGWMITDNTANCNVWRTKPFNASNLTLESSAKTVLNLWVF
jgi:hypothetical protein